jgi:hypothetical protein
MPSRYMAETTAAAAARTATTLMLVFIGVPLVGLALAGNGTRHQMEAGTAEHHLDPVHGAGWLVVDGQWAAGFGSTSARDRR